MCWACEQDALWCRYLMHVVATQDIIPERLDAADFEAASAPVPGTAAAKSLAARPSGVGVPANQFACDSPDRQ
jgi:hypothetical protein